MLRIKITTKYELIKLIQETNIKQVVAEDIRSIEELKDLYRAAERHLRSKKRITMFVITTRE